MDKQMDKTVVQTMLWKYLSQQPAEMIIAYCQCCYCCYWFLNSFVIYCLLFRLVFNSLLFCRHLYPTIKNYWTAHRTGAHQLLHGCGFSTIFCSYPWARLKWQFTVSFWAQICIRSHNCCCCSCYCWYNTNTAIINIKLLFDYSLICKFSQFSRFNTKYNKIFELMLTGCTKAYSSSYLQAVTHRSTNRARRRVTSFQPKRVTNYATQPPIYINSTQYAVNNSRHYGTCSVFSSVYFPLLL